MSEIIPVVLCGGSGTRLWPLSRKGFPKQFISFTGKHSLFQQTLMRLSAVANNQRDIIIVTNEMHRFLASEQLSELEGFQSDILLESASKNTAPALTLAALRAVEKGEDPVLLVSPSDQTINNEDAFVEALTASVHVAESGAIVVLGVKADKPETGYGYIQRTGESGAHGEYVVSSFVEKPDLATAKTYVDSGDYAWNGGMFVLKASVWLAALQQFQSEMYESLITAWESKTQDGSFIRVSEALFANVPEESIDYAVIEHCPGVIPIKMIPLDAGWSDLGAWDAVWDFSDKDSQGNSLHGDAVAFNTTNSLLYSSGRMVRTAGVDNIAVIETADAVMVIDKSQSQDVKAIVQALKDQGREEQLLHRKVNRPWGWYDSIDEDERFKVKRISVKPGASLSLQKHHHRAEHWIVVKGTAEVTCGDQVMTLTENQSTYIPLGEVHRLSNPGSIPLEIIEVQSGSYLGEDDIVRLDDTYGRVKV